jgi:hypothetical protein
MALLRLNATPTSSENQCQLEDFSNNASRSPIAMNQ